MELIWLKVWSEGGKFIFHSIDGEKDRLEIGDRLAEKASQMIKIKKKIATTEIWLPMEDTMFQVM
jgi:hypothetical protein